MCKSCFFSGNLPHAFSVVSQFFKIKFQTIFPCLCLRAYVPSYRLVCHLRSRESHLLSGRVIELVFRSPFKASLDSWVSPESLNHFCQLGCHVAIFQRICHGVKLLLVFLEKYFGGKKTSKLFRLGYFKWSI